MSLTFLRKYPARYAPLDGRREVGWSSMHYVNEFGVPPPLGAAMGSGAS
jgi:hypothetical protein